MYYCLKCRTTHEEMNREKLFRTAFHHLQENRYVVGYCLSERTCTNSTFRLERAKLA